MLSLKAFLSERLTLAAEEIFAAVEKTIIEYKEELCRSKDIEITRLRMQLKILKSEPQSVSCLGAQLLQHAHHLHALPPAQQQQLHQSASAADPPEAQHYEEEREPGPEEEEEYHEEEGSSVDPEHPEPSQVKKEPTKSHRDFWLAHDGEQLDDLEPDMKDFISPPAGLKPNLHDPALIFHPYHLNGVEDGRDKPYCCSVCEKRFTNCSHLAAHIRTHTGERPYRCEICRKTFITTSALNRHQTIHTEGKRFVCTYCGKSFKWMESLGRHIRVVHKKDNVSV
ncbi:zinc finger and BTB domain-containing protein 49-like [Salarias fasciatus]|uniref:Zinc finger and BTB domain-containing protein 49-like n=1 Tax=Salarias fasciatus TaxID=181472 RepID=A0A672HGT1_SALFA|nr:zinc finger and BTB domain-containing protein 49-like [Salarias fasciatus]